MNLFFNRPKKTRRAAPEKNQEPEGIPVHKIEIPDSSPKATDSLLRKLDPTMLESKAGTAWYSQHAPLVPKGIPMDGRLLSQNISVEIGKFIRRIPADLLREGPHDPKRRIEFKAADLVAIIGQRKPSVTLSAIARACPDIFLSEISSELDAEIYFPWHSVVSQLSALCVQSRTKWNDSSMPGEQGNAATMKPEESEDPKSKNSADDSAFMVAEEPCNMPGCPDAGTSIINIGAMVIESSAGQPACEPVSSEKLAQERDLAIRQRDEALAEVERLKVALRHASEALEAVCKTSGEEKKTD